jgi:uncharacterized membrane protein YccF (DUF307 family)
MSDVSLILNVLWIIFGGLWMAVGWLIAAVIMAITIVGLPWARAAVRIAAYTLFPFGQKVVSRAAVTGRDDIGTGPIDMIGNLIWLIFGRLVAHARPCRHGVLPAVPSSASRSRGRISS